MDGGVTDGASQEQGVGQDGRGASVLVRWLAWFGLCIGMGIALGLVMLPGQTEAAPERAVPALREAPVFSVAMDAGYTVRSSARFGRGAPAAARPRIAIVIDDLGLSEKAFARVNALPGPLTLAFLPYGEDAQGMLDAVRPVHEPILHLPTEPVARLQDAGPDMLRVAGAPAIRRALAANLAKLSGYEGVNNHTGSRFTADPASMRVLLEELDARGLYFLDSVTAPRPVSVQLAAANGYAVAARDVFLDDDYAGGEAAVRAQLAKAERIALAEGQAIAIGHPYRATAAALGPWLVTAQARGFELVVVSELARPGEAPVLARLR